MRTFFVSRNLIVIGAAFVCACAGSIPSIPDTADAIIAKGDQYYAQGKYFQASELYKAFLERFPGNDRSDYAQFYLAESYFNDEQYAVAAVDYRIIFSNYGYSEYVDDALFKTGVCFWLDSADINRDQQKTMDAKGMFDQFIQTFPQSEFVDEARGYINKINEKLARKNIVTVRWYHRRNHPRAAIIYCDKILDNFPGNESWVEAAYTKGCILLDLGRSDEAIVEFNRVLAYPDRTKFHDDAQSKLAQAKSR